MSLIGPGKRSVDLLMVRMDSEIGDCSCRTLPSILPLGHEICVREFLRLSFGSDVSIV